MPSTTDVPRPKAQRTWRSMASPNKYGHVRSPAAGSRAGGAFLLPDEEAPLLGAPSPSPPPGRKPRWREKLTAEVDLGRADVMLLFCYIITGLLDGAAVEAWGSFVSMQTGNTVYIGLGLAAPNVCTRWYKHGVSVLFFCLGSFFFSRFHRCFTPARRWVLCASFLLQMALVAVTAAIMTWAPSASSSSVFTTSSFCPPSSATPSPSDSVSWTVLVPVALVAFQSSAQAVMSRVLKYNTLTSVVLTSIYCDLFSDAELFASLAHNAERNRRAAAPLLLLLGAILGGLVSGSAIGTAGALWIVAAIKLAVAVCWLFWPAAEA